MSFLGLSLKDVVVGAVSMVPGVGAIAGAAVDGVWTGIETGSITKGLEAAAITGVTSAFPGGRVLGRLLARPLGALTETVGRRFGGNIVGRAINTLGGHAIRGYGGRGARGVGRSLGRAIGRGAGGATASALFNPGGSDSGKDATTTVAAVPTRPAGADMSNRYFGAKDSKAVLEYDSDGKAQQPYKVVA